MQKDGNARIVRNVRLSEEEEKDFQMDGCTGYLKEQMKQNILKQHSIFTHQVQELHRLYKRQRDLMNELTRKEHYAFFRVFAEDYGTMGLRYGTPNLSAGATFVQYTSYIAGGRGNTNPNYYTEKRFFNHYKRSEGRRDASPEHSIFAGECFILLNSALTGNRKDESNG
ncbi:hypothetical protein Tco_0957929 [Tanacetum coccineum]